MADEVQLDLDTDRIKEWRSIVTLIVFVAANLMVLFPFHIPLWLPQRLVKAFFALLTRLRVLPPRLVKRQRHVSRVRAVAFERWNFPMDFVTAPLIADLFLLAIGAIGRTEVHDGTVGANHIAPIDIMVFFLSLAYIALSIDASGTIRWLACRVLRKGGKHGYRLYFYLYTFFFIMACFVGNDPIVLSGTAFLAYLTRASRNINNATAWIYAQFTVANIGSAVLVSSNPTNLVLAGAFGIKFIAYTANVIVPVLGTIILLFPFLLSVLFRKDGLIPHEIELEELPENIKNAEPVNPNIPQESHKQLTPEEQSVLAISTVLNPYLDKKSAIVGVVVMSATLITILVMNATSSNGEEHPVFWVTLPAAVLMLSWDLCYGWLHRHETRQIAANSSHVGSTSKKLDGSADDHDSLAELPVDVEKIKLSQESIQEKADDEKQKRDPSHDAAPRTEDSGLSKETAPDKIVVEREEPISAEKPVSHAATALRASDRRTAHSEMIRGWKWLRRTFPASSVVMTHLPLKLVPFALCMFVLVQALVTKGWVAVFAYGWNHWVDRTGVVGAIGGMGFLSIILCNFAGTNIGTAILLCRVVQSWVEMHQLNGSTITNRKFWATVYSMTIGLNYGAFSTAFSASLAGLLWRSILERMGIHVRSRDFALINVPIIAIATTIALVILIGQIYITRDTEPYVPNM
ncbi:hypothetical protein CERZMDRAFT_106858 [Cercospora zeae-maydis SCOH1-5]|uniref:Citrate transporter-like domain-containing protein n=1 Tax=Cercospora zeae-maydis SCOH1-5 TaxID=717836 RepID=A0A6A6F9X0_9PEZI|nr:hypothetical protein CERZMDRAFT_106858 [Cercospora zeae-maydis SCOH1-5]